MKLQLHFIVLPLLLMVSNLQAQITHDNNTIISNSNPLSITVPIGSNKGLIVIPASGESIDFTFDPFNGQLAKTLISAESLSMYMFPLGDVTTAFTANLSYAESGKTLTIFTINNVDQSLNPEVQPTIQAAGEFIIPHHGGFEKKAGDMALTALNVENYASNFNLTPFTVFNSENNTVTNEYQLLVNNGAAPYLAHYSSIISSPDEYTLFFLDDPNIGAGSTGISFDCRKVGVILRSVVDTTLSNPDQDQDIFEFKVFPNPTTSNLHFNKPVKGIYHIYNMLGQEVLTSKDSITIEEVDISKLSSGTYIIKIDTLNGKTLEKQFVIK